MNIWGITNTGSVRQQNQDAYRVEPLPEDGLLAVVCDGMGGARSGNVASQMAVHLFGDAVLEGFQLPQVPSPDELLRTAAELANERIYDRALNDPSCLGMGTTLVAALVREGTVHVINVGDSRAYAISRAGIRRVTRDHSVVEDLVARGEITPDEARLHPQKNLITRALGADAAAQPDLYQLPAVPGEFLLLCSDGLSNVVTDQELLYEVIHGGASDQCCQRLLDVALSRGAPDNVTAVLLQM